MMHMLTILFTTTAPQTKGVHLRALILEMHSQTPNKAIKAIAGIQLAKKAAWLIGLI